MQAAVILNPAAARGRSLKRWPEIAAALATEGVQADLHTTRSAGHATALARERLQQGQRWLIAVGGDGTLNEVVNGFFDADGQPLAPEAWLSVLMCGTGGDFARTLRQPADLQQAVRQLVQAAPRQIDIGRLDCQQATGAACTRYFINIASLGLGGAVSYRLNQSRLLARLHGQLAFLLATLHTFAEFKPRRVSLRWAKDGQTQTLQLPIQQVAVANGRFHGAGMQVAPLAELDDGQFDVVLLEATPRLRSLLSLARVYKGQHLHDPGVRWFATDALEVSAEGPAPVWLECDGENPGCLPARFRLLPRSLWLKA